MLSLPILPMLAAAEGGASVTAIFLQLAALIAAARLGGAIAKRVGQPTVLGELLAGILIGPSLLGLADPNDPFVHLLAELGVVILLFQIGLHTDLTSLLRVGPAAGAVGAVGVVLPFALGYGAAHLFGLDTIPALVCGAALTATSIGISARILGDLKMLETIEGKTVLGAAVLDDVVGLVILAVVATMAGGGAVTAGSIATTVGAAVGFLIIAIALGNVVAPKLFHLIDRLPVRGTTAALALAFALALAALADLVGSAMIIGAFAAGLILHRTPQRERIEDATTTLGHFFVPVFFASVGAAVELSAMVDPTALMLGGILLAIGVAGKFVAGYAPFWVPMRKAIVGAAMVPRGEVGLIFARMGLATGALNPELFGGLMIMVIGTTVITPPWLAWLAGSSRAEMTAMGRTAQPQDIGTVDDLVMGERDG
ncbi:MAG TPA: cation:proton antiporter [Gemmatimonadales bacterium]|nr:cation:proton antiporter [Gemmatimonadales bacterium]